MNFFLDENFPKRAFAVLQSCGHTVFDVRGTEKEGMDDVSIFSMAQECQAVFLTTDRDFFHTIPQLFAIHQGVVVIALRQPTSRGILARQEWLLVRIGNNSMAGKTYLLRDKTYVVYPAGVVE